MGSAIDISRVPSPIDRPRSYFVVWLAVLGIMSLLWPLSSARAQFVCSTSGNTETCTNSGTSTSFTNSTAGGQNASTNNSGTVNGFDATQTIAGGDATTTNSGTVTQYLSTYTQAGGNATTTNSGNVGQYAYAYTQAGGNATTTNSGNVGQYAYAYTQAGGNATTTNSGNVGQYAYAYTQAGGNATTTNSGNVGQYAYAYTSAGGNATTTNSGKVGQYAYAYTQAGGNATTTNSGKVGQYAYAYTQAGGNATTTNSGKVGQYAYAYTQAGGNATLTNSGSVGTYAYVYTQAGGNATMSNSGTIDQGVTLTALGGGSSNLTNSGLIIGGPNPAIKFVGGPDTLTNVVGSRVIGAIDLVGVKDTVNFAGGNWLFTFNTLAGATINTNGAPFVVSGNQVAVLDPTAIALADRSLMFVTGGVSQMLRDRFSGITTGGGGQSAMSFAAPDSFGVAEQAQAPFANIPSVAMSYASDPKPILGKAPAAAPYYDTTVWTSGFGGERIQDAYGSILPATETAFGGAIGVDRSFGWDWRLGAFLGGGFGREAVELNVQTVDTDYFFGGVYGHVDWAAQFLNLALYGGSMSNASTRGVANNLAPGGFQSATANYGGWFISPELTYGIHIPGNDFVWTPRIIVRYVGGSIDGFTETGSAQNLSLGAQAINDVEERAEIEFSKVMPASFGGTFKTTADIGVIGLERVGNSNINAVLLGQNLAFVTPGAASAVGLVVGGAVQYRPTPSVALYLSAEGTVMSDNSVTGALAGGARISF